LKKLHRLVDFMDVVKRPGIVQDLEFVDALSNSLGCKPVPQVADLHCSKEGFWQVDL
jgi:hypothetical protein